MVLTLTMEISELTFVVKKEKGTIETFSIRQTANRSLQLRVCSLALPRFQILARRSVQSSVQFVFI